MARYIGQRIKLASFKHILLRRYLQSRIYWRPPTFLDTISHYAGVITAKGLTVSKQKRLKREQRRLFDDSKKLSPLGNSRSAPLRPSSLVIFTSLDRSPFSRPIQYPNLQHVCAFCRVSYCWSHWRSSNAEIARVRYAETSSREFGT